jgi:hypothetical protein
MEDEERKTDSKIDMTACQCGHRKVFHIPACMNCYCDKYEDKNI